MKVVLSDTTMSGKEMRGHLLASREYVVLEMIVHASRAPLYRIEVEPGGAPALFDSRRFEVVDHTLPASWQMHSNGGASWTFTTAELAAAGFWERFFDGDEATVLAYELVCNRLTRESGGERSRSRPLRMQATSDEHALHGVIWADALIESIHMDYDDVVVRLRESSGRRVDVRCRGFIGLDVRGFWDEMIVEDAHVYAEHPVLRSSLERLATRMGNTLSDCGNARRNECRFLALAIRLIDGCTINIAAARFDVGA